MMPMLTKVNISDLDQLQFLELHFSLNQHLTNFSNKVTIHIIPTYPIFVECCAHSVTQVEPIPRASLRFSHLNKANTVQ